MSRQRLLRVLGLSSDASLDRIESRALLLLGPLRRRLEGAREPEAQSLRNEIAELESAIAELGIGRTPEASGQRTILSPTRLGALAGIVFALILLFAYASGLRLSGPSETESTARIPSEGELILDGRLPGAMLRVLDTDREELLLRVPAQGARIALAEGRYALEVSREDCPDSWTRSVYFEAGQTQRFEPTLCLGEGELVVRSNVSRDRLKIDGLDVGPTGEKAHLLGVGDHQVRVEKAGFESFDGKVRILPDDLLELRVELVAGDEGGPVGRPMPVAKVAPTSAPPASNGPDGLDLAGLREDIAAHTGPMGLARPDLRLDDISNQITTGGGSTAWHDLVSADMLARYDLDGSGRIDRLEESETIPCSVWGEIERNFDGGGLGLTMTRYYGFDGSEWHPGALGVARAHRSAVFERMKECGLRRD